MSEAGNGLKAGVKPAGAQPVRKASIGSVMAGLVGTIWVVFCAICVFGMALSDDYAGLARPVGIILMVLSGLVAFPITARAIRYVLPILRPAFAPPVLAAVLFLGFCVVLVAGSDAPSQPAETLTASEAKGSEPTVRDQAQRAAVTTGIEAMWSEVKEATRPCDQAAGRVSDLLGSSNAANLPAAYAAAEQAERACGQSGLDVMGVKVPRALPRDERRAFDEALTQCGTAYAGKSVLFREMRTVIDGDMRPSRVSRVQEAGAVSQGQVLMCVAQLVQLAQEQGVNLEETSS